jgi:restriction system protein
MRHRNASVLASLVMAPWWLSLLVSVGAYAFVAYVLPATLGQHDRLLGPLAHELPKLAPVTALLFLIPAPLSAIRQWRARRLLNAQSGLDSIRTMGWRQFETLVAEAYRREGYVVEETGGGGPDGGVDLVVRKGGTFLVQCKHWKAYQVGVKQTRELLGVVTAERASGGILITSGGFTAEAEDFARGQPVELVDGPQLVKLVRLRAPRGMPFRLALSVAGAWS